MFQIVCRYSKKVDSLSEMMKTYSSVPFESVEKAKEALVIRYKNMLVKDSTKQVMWSCDKKSFLAMICINTASGEGYQIAEYKIEAL